MSRGLAAGRDRSGPDGSTAAPTPSACWSGSRTASAVATCSSTAASAGATRGPSSCRAAWEAARSQVCRILGRQATAAAETGSTPPPARRRLSTDRRQPAGQHGRAASRRSAGRDVLTLTAAGQAGRTGQPGRRSARRWPACSPAWTCPKSSWRSRPGPASPASSPTSARAAARVTDLAISLCAVLLAEACNIGLEPLVRPDVPALTRGRLAWVQQNYVRAETLIRANARLVDAQAQIPLAQAWGGGEVASADGLRFVVPVRTVNAGPNRKYFGTGRGITYYNFTTDQFTGFHGIVDPRHAPRLAVHPGRAAGAADRPAPPRGHERHGRVQRRGLRPVLAAGLPVQPPAGRLRRGPVLADGPDGRLRRAERPGAAPGATPS